MSAGTETTKFRWSVSQKVAALLLIPLSIQVLLLFGLLGLQERTQRLAELEAKQSELVQCLNVLLIDGANAWGSFVTPFVTGRQMEEISPEVYRDKLESDYAAIIKLKTVNSEVLGLLKDVKRFSDQEYATLKELQNMPEADSSVSSMFLKLKILRPQLKNLGHRISVLNDAVRAETRKLEQTRQKERASRQQVKTQILLGIFLDVVFASGMLFIFQKSLKIRLQKLIASARVVPVADELKETVGGTDELAYLDGVLHAAVSDLNMARQHRAAVAAMVAHDLRTPLMSISLASNTLRDTKGIDQIFGVPKLLKSLNVNLRRVFALVEDLLTIERVESGKLELRLENFELTGLVDDAFQTIEELAASKELVLEKETNGFEVVADRDRVLQVLLNYLSNAVKFSPPKSRIIVKAEVQGEKLITSVIDEGPGISVGDQAALFQKFSQTSLGKEKGGVGLGLSICKMLVVKHGGDTGVESQVGKGSRFWFSLPYEADP